MNFRFASTRLFEHEVNGTSYIDTEEDDDTVVSGIRPSSNDLVKEKLLRLQLNAADAEQVEYFREYHADVLNIILRDVKASAPTLKVFDNHGEELNSICSHDSLPQFLHSRYPVELHSWKMCIPNSLTWKSNGWHRCEPI